MEAPEDKNKDVKSPADIGSLEKEMKNALKEGDFEGAKTVYDKLKKADPENRLADKLMRKMQKIKEKEGKKEKLRKAKEYKTMLRTLLKNRDVEKLEALAKEFKEFDPDSRHAAKWLLRAERLKEKTGGKTEKKPAVPKPLAIGLKKEAPLRLTPIPTPPVKPLVVPTPNVKPLVVPQPKPKPAEPVKQPAPPKDEPKGNIFTKMFGKKEETMNEKSIIDTIVARTDKMKEKEVIQKEMEPEKPDKKGTSLGLLTFSKAFMNFIVIFIVFSAAFLYVEWIDTGNTMLSLAGISENTGGRLHSASEKLGILRRQEAILNKDIELYKEGYDDKAVSTIESIIKSRINWPDIFGKINEVTNSVYELNDFFKYIEYNNYSFDAENRTIRVTGALSDPLGRNLTKLVELEEAFKYYPKDKNNPDDTTEPYFTGFKEFTSFSKTLDPTTNRYNSSFQLSFALNE
ncbi:MAG: hypothetical protein V1880_01685 [Patescibacteria group bacterium]